jgi:hypothetical protein
VYNTNITSKKAKHAPKQMLAVSIRIRFDDCSKSGNEEND